MELYQLEYFRVLCKYGNYTKASEHLMVTQPAVSIAIKKLEEEFHTELINRKEKKFILTPAGDALLKSADLLHTEMTYIYQMMNAFATERKEVLQIAFPVSCCPELITKIAVWLREEMPNVSVALSKVGHEQIISGLENQTLDLGIVYQKSAVPPLGFKHFKRVELYVGFPENHHFREYECVTPDLLKGEVLLLSKTDLTLSEYIRRYLVMHGVEPFESCLLEGDICVEDARQLAAEGIGIAFAERQYLGENSRPLNPPLYIDLSIAWCRKEPLILNGIPQKKQIIDIIVSHGDK